MSSLKSVNGLLSRLDKNANKPKSQGNSSYKELNEARKLAFAKLKPGKNQVAFLTPKGAQDPFSEWGYHTGLQEVSYYSVPCDKFNKNEECVICNIVDSLQQEDWQGNKHIWMPIQQKTEVYAPTINLESDETKAQGPKWQKISKSQLDQLLNWLKNLESDEVPFYDEEEPQRVIINYDPEAAPKDQYKLDKKNMKPFSQADLDNWKEKIKSVSSYFVPKSKDEIKKILDEYFVRVEEMVSNSDSKETVSEKKESVTKENTSKENTAKEKKTSRLSKLADEENED